MDKTVFRDKIPSRILFKKYSSQSEVLRSGISMAVQWLRLCAPIAGGVGLTPGQGNADKDVKQQELIHCW